MIALQLAKAAGIELSAQDVGTVIAAINIILRIFTKGKITLTNADNSSSQSK